MYKMEYYKRIKGGSPLISSTSITIVYTHTHIYIYIYNIPGILYIEIKTMFLLLL